MTRDDKEKRKAFETALEEDPEDWETRQIFADWLEERGLDEEAREQREWSSDDEEDEDEDEDVVEDCGCGPPCC